MNARTLNYILGAALLLILTVAGLAFWMTDQYWEESVFYSTYDHAYESYRTLDALDEGAMSSAIGIHQAKLHSMLLRLAEPDIAETPNNGLPSDFRSSLEAIFAEPEIYLPPMNQEEVAALKTAIDRKFAG